MKDFKVNLTYIIHCPCGEKMQFYTTKDGILITKCENIKCDNYNIPFQIITPLIQLEKYNG